jgi:hypothetical protein
VSSAIKWALLSPLVLLGVFFLLLVGLIDLIVELAPDSMKDE